MEKQIKLIRKPVEVKKVGNLNQILRDGKKIVEFTDEQLKQPKNNFVFQVLSRRK